jgi:hypothetical protein
MPKKGLPEGQSRQMQLSELTHQVVSKLRDGSNI